MKKKILTIAAVMICLSLITGGTLAYYTTAATARNVITSGGVDIAVVEQQRMEDGTLVAYPNRPIRIMPATTVSKIVSVKSTGQNVWIRANYTFTVYDSEKQKMDIPADELAQVVRMDHNSACWTERGGWWYYTAGIGAGDATEPFFTEVTFSGPDMDNKYQGCTLVIHVAAQAVQKANNGNTVMDALGWPEG